MRFQEAYTGWHEKRLTQEDAGQVWGVTIRSYLAALRRRNVFHALTLAFQGQAPDPLPSG